MRRLRPLPRLARCLLGPWLALLCAWPGAALAGAPLQFAWQRTGEQAQLWTSTTADPALRAQALPASLRTPLGSVWKLFVYAYLVDRRLPSEDYRCGEAHPGLSDAQRERLRQEELYCCHAGERIDRERALVQSCGLYFEPARLRLDPPAWRDYWHERQAPAWLAELSTLGPDREVPVAALLAALRAVPADTRVQAGYTLVSVLTLGRGEGTVAGYGSLLRAKTWTMPDPRRPGASLGGAAGWLADGTPVWLSGAGGSRRVLADAAPLLQPLLARVDVPDGDACVVVDYFERYPIRRVLPTTGSAPVPDGALDGRYRIEFANGQHLAIDSHGELSLRRDRDAPQVVGRLGLNDYVARVIDREGDAGEPAAGAALAVAARSYLIQQAPLDHGCWRIADASRTQRVAPRPPSAAARRLAAWTDSLVLAGVEVQYHRDRAAPGRLAWQDAVRLARDGLGFDAILARTWPGATLTSFLSPLGGDCLPLPGAQRWLAAQAPSWQRRLEAEPGFEAPPLPAVCQLREGRPYADARRDRVYVHGLGGEEDRIALAHEYLHLAFARHPRGQDERFVELRARALLAPQPAASDPPQGAGP